MTGKQAAKSGQDLVTSSKNVRARIGLLPARKNRFHVFIFPAVMSITLAMICRDETRWKSGTAALRATSIAAFARERRFCQTRQRAGVVLRQANRHWDQFLVRSVWAYKLAPKATKRPSQSFTTNSREFHGMLPSSRVNSTPRAAYSA